MGNMRKVLFRLLRYSGIPFLFREFVQRHKVTILLFHDIDPESALQAFSYIQRHYWIIGLQDYLQARRTGRHLHRKSVIITFDDGHASNYRLLPILRQLQIPITIFLCSDIVGTNRHFWFKHCGGNAQALKKLTNQQRLEALRAYGYEQTREYEDVQALNRQQIQEMRDYVDFQSHTCFHPILMQCDDETARSEILLSKQHLEQDFSLRITSFSYPNGDYSPREIQLAKEAGYTCAITVDPGYNSLTTDPFRLKRLSVNEARSLDELIVKSSGCYAIMKRFFWKNPNNN